MTIAIEAPRQPEVEALLAGSEAFALATYPADSCYLLDVSELEAPGVTVWVARLDGVAVGMAALVAGPEFSELKRLYVDESARGRGQAVALLEVIEQHAREAGTRLIRLETGPKSFAAIALYEKLGYTRIPNFGQYVGDPHSYCMEKRLAG